MDGLRELGREIWFNLGDRDLAIGLERARALAQGVRLTEAHAAIVRGQGVRAAVLPASDRPVRTQIMTGGRWLGFQEFMVAEQARGDVDDVAFHGHRAAAPTPEVLAALAAAQAILIGPSNPV